MLILLNEIKELENTFLLEYLESKFTSIVKGKIQMFLNMHMPATTKAKNPTSAESENIFQCRNFISLY